MLICDLRPEQCKVSDFTLCQVHYDTQWCTELFIVVMYNEEEELYTWCDWVIGIIAYMWRGGRIGPDKSQGAVEGSGYVMTKTSKTIYKDQISCSGMSKTSESRPIR